jgi:hypothetical protein
MWEILHSLVAGLHETAKVVFGDFRQSGSDVVKFTLPHPSLQTIHKVEEVIERVHDEE